jgi:conjugal transfer pilus assembly protein TraU
MKRWLVMAFMVLAATFARESMAGVCQGKFANPITDICWSCLFPLTLGGTPIMTMGQEDTGNPDGFLCTCTNPLRIGIKTGFWEPARRVDVTRTRTALSRWEASSSIPVSVPRKARSVCSRTTPSNPTIRFIGTPIRSLYWLEVILDNPCLETGSFDVAYITVDPTWNDDELTMLLNPETFLFGNPIASRVCRRLRAVIGRLWQ